MVKESTIFTTSNLAQAWLSSVVTKVATKWCFLLIALFNFPSDEMLVVYVGVLWAENNKFYLGNTE